MTNVQDVRVVAFRRGWRVVDIVVASVLGVASGVVFWALGLAWTPLTNALAFFQPAGGLIVGGWLFAGVLGGLVIRKPGAAVYTEILAAVVEMLAGNQWGFSTFIWGLVQGLATELVFLLLAYRRWGLGVAAVAGLVTGIASSLLDTVFGSYTAWSPTWKLSYIGFAAASGLVIAGVLMWLAVRALAATGALAPFAAGRAGREV